MLYDGEVDPDVGMQNDSFEDCVPTEDYEKNEYSRDDFEDGNIPTTNGLIVAKVAPWLSQMV